jgi:hypothetical protein
MAQQSGQWNPPRVPGAKPVRRPGTVDAATAFAYAQAGVTTLTTLASWVATMMFPNRIAGFGRNDLGLIAVVGLAQIAGIGLLIVGGAGVFKGEARGTLIAGCALELVICGFYLVRYALMPQLPSHTFLVWCAVAHAVMPVIGLLLIQGKEARRYLQRPAR